MDGSHQNRSSAKNGRLVRLSRFRYLAALLVAVAAIAGVGAQAASASNCGNGGCAMFAWGPANGLFTTAPGGVVVGMICWTDANSYAGTNRWFFVSTVYGNGRAWVSANQVKNQITVRHC